MNWTEAEYHTYLARHVASQSALYSPGDNNIEESELQATIRQGALRHGWLYYHTHDSRGSDSGFPDTVLARPGALIFAELKNATRKATQAQLVWLDILGKSVPGVEAYLWRPRDLATALARLVQQEGPTP